MNIQHNNIKIKRTLLLDYVHATPWAIAQEKLDAIHSVLFAHYNDKTIDLEAVETAIGRELNNSFNIVNQNGNAIIPVQGVISKRMNMLQAISGGVSTELVQKSIEAALADPAVNQIILQIDSSGGAVDGTKELADYIYNARGQKPILAYIDGCGCSAAYWIASAADQIVAYDTALIGSIGVVMAHYDYSKQMEQQGVTKTYIYAGKYKRIAPETQPLNKEGEAYLQHMVDTFYSIFVESVARNRGVSVEKVLKEMADAKTFIGEEALQAGLIDKIGSFSSLLAGADSGSAFSASNMELGAFTHNSSVAPSEPSWGSVDKTKLPRAAFAEKGTDKKSSWGFPHHFISGGKNLDSNGVYTDGTMYLHKGGLNTAWSAAQGARSGQKASSAVIAHLEAHRRALGLDKNTNSVAGKKEEKIMDLQELKETHPALVQAIESEAKAKLGDENQKLQVKVAELQTKVETLDTVNKDLVKSLSLMEEKASSALAENIKKSVLSESDVPENLHPKVMGMVDYHPHVKEGEKFAEGTESAKNFTEAFKMEVKDWEQRLGKKTGAGLSDGKEDSAAVTGGDEQYGRDLARRIGAIRSDKK